MSTIMDMLQEYFRMYRLHAFDGDKTLIKASNRQNQATI